jgi:tetratricopeptide (TPR) repeat protein
MAEAVSERYKEALRLGHVAVAKGRPREAVEHYEAAGRLAGARPLAFVRMGSIYLQMRQPREANEAFDEALRRAPDDLESLRGKAEALEATGETAQATAVAQRGRELEAASDAGMAAQRARVEAAHGNERHIDAALHALEAGDRPVAVGAYMTAAQGYFGQQAYDAAFDAVMRALQLEPGAIPIHMAMADMYLQRGWKALGVERLLLLEHRLSIEAEPGAKNALGQLAARHRAIDPEIDRIAGTYA